VAYRIAPLLNHVVSLRGGHLAPLPAQFLAPLQGHLPKLSILIAHVLLLLRRQTFELLPSLPQQLPLFGRHCAPLREPLLCGVSLLRTHREPSPAAFGQRLLALRRQ
jgi:hypothetical protein